MHQLKRRSAGSFSFPLEVISVTFCLIPAIFCTLLFDPLIGHIRMILSELFKLPKNGIILVSTLCNPISKHKELFISLPTIIDLGFLLVWGLHNKYLRCLL